MTKRVLLASACLFLPFLDPAAAIDLDENQVLIEATIVSITQHELMGIDLAPFEPGEVIDAFTRAQLLPKAELAATQTQSVITAIEGDASLAASPVGVAALSHLEIAHVEQIQILVALDALDLPKAKDLTTPLALGIHFQVAAVNALQGRPGRFSEGKKADREAREFWSAYTSLLPWIESHGLPTDRSGLFEPFSGGNGKTLLDGIGFDPGDYTRFKIRKGRLEFSSLSKEPMTSGADFEIDLPDDFTVLLTFTLPEKGGDKPRDEYAGFSAGLKVTTDRSSNPAEAFFIEHQTSPQGWAQSFTSTKTSIIQVYPHGTPSRTRQITSFLVKDDDEIVIGGLLKDGANETLIQNEVPVLGNVPVLGFFFRNGTKKTVVEADDLLIFLTPHVIEEP